MAFVGEAILSAAVENLFNKLASPKLLEFAKREKIRDDIKKWKKILPKIRAVLDDAEEKQMKRQAVKTWLSDLNQLVYDVEDILDEFATEDLRIKLVNEPQASTSTVQKLIPPCFTGLSPSSIKFNVKMAHEIKDITTRLEEIVTHKDNLNLIENSGGRSYGVGYRRWPETSVNEPHIYGREKDKEAILDFLLKDEGGSDGNFSVVSVVGMGGIGKTTLAQLAYNDDKVQAFFDVKAWASVSDEFDVVRLTKSILKSVDREANDYNELDELQVELKKKLSEKKFLIVLDDVWNERYDDWTLLCRPFQAGSLGSRILVTTRNLGVSRVVGTLQTYQLNQLSIDDCLSLFTRHSLGKTNFDEYRYLEEIGKKIIKRCDGLPLAAKALGGLLRGKVSCEDWEDVLNSKIWNLPETKCGIMPALRLSYHYLSSCLKKCFLYCSIFPKDYEFSKDEIILLWMAEGFLETSCSEKHKEDLGDDYFQDLLTRSFFQESSSNASSFVMHDLIHDLAQWAAADTCLRIENLRENEKPREIPKHLRHLAYLNVESFDGCIQKFESFNELKSLRTFSTLSPKCSQFEPSCDFPSVLLQLRRLRVLSLKGYPPILELPNSIGDLKFLRHLDLSYSRIEFLPDSINTLYNLETLKLNHCPCLTRWCSDMGNLIKLRYLYLQGTLIFSLPSGIGRLTSLRMLESFFVDKDKGLGLRELKDLKNLQGSLCILWLQNVNDLRDAEQADLNGKGDLKRLCLSWSDRNDGLNEKNIAAQVLEKLQPCKKLESLEILGFGGTQLPKWLGDTAFSGLVSLKFGNCRNCALLPSIGQLPSLKELSIWNMSELKSLGSEFYGLGNSTPFQSLEQFEIGHLQDWTEWIPYKSDRNVQAFPRLRQLLICFCPKLQGTLPKHLPSLESLSIHHCEQCTVSVPVLPKHCAIKIDKCREVVLESIRDCSPLSSMVHLLSGISREMTLVEGVAERFSKVGQLDVVKYIEPTFFLKSEIPSLQKLKTTELYYSEYVDSFPLERVIEELQQQELHGRCQYLLLQDCKCPVKLEQALQSLSFLRGICIRASLNLKFFPEVALPSQLRVLLIVGWNSIQPLPKAWMHSSNMSLQTLILCNSRGLSSIGRVQLPPNLKRLEIKDCFNLVTVSDEEEVPGSSSNSFRLEYLNNESCPSQSKNSDLRDSDREIKLSSCSNHASVVSRGTLPMALKSLHIEDCPKLVSVAKSFHNNMSLEELMLIRCDRLETLPSGLNNLTSLQSLVIDRCPVASIPEGGFPTSLTSLVIAYTNIHQSLFEWGLNRLTSLKLLRIARNWDVISFPQEETEIVLPTSVIALRIEEFGYLERLSSIAQNLPCLEYLGLFGCPKLKFLTDELKCLPDEGWPQSLKRLEIEGCPLLEEYCGVGKPGYRPMIPQISDNTILHFFPDDDSVLIS